MSTVNDIVEVVRQPRLPSIRSPRATAGRVARLALTRYGVVLAFLLLWQVAASRGWINAAVFPPLDAILAALWKGIAGGALLDDIAISLQRAGLAFAAAVAVAIPLGLLMGQIRPAERALDPILQFFRQTSALALYPVFILLLGLGEASKVFVIFWATLFPLLLATIGGVKEVEPKLVEMARVYGALRSPCSGASSFRVRSRRSSSASACRRRRRFSSSSPPR